MRSILRASCLVPLIVLLPSFSGLDATRAVAASDSPCRFNSAPSGFPLIPIWAYAGAYQDSSLLKPQPRGEVPRCWARTGGFQGPLPDSIRQEGRTITVRFLRDRKAEARDDFGGYRIYRVYNTPDTTRMVLIRRFSHQTGDERTWSFSNVVDSTLAFKCGDEVVNDSVVTFIDPDSNGNFIKVCRKRIPPNDPLGACDPTSRGDSTFVLLKPPGPHQGFRTWYAVTYEARNRAADATYEDLFVPDTTGIIGPCGNPADKNTCPNLNNRCYNMTQNSVEATGGPTANLERVGVVPNPFRAHEAWDRPGFNELHFTNLPERATIKIYTLAGDLVVQLEHDQQTQDFERWDLKNQSGRDVSSGIYMYRIESRIGSFTFQDRFIVIR